MKRQKRDRLERAHQRTRSTAGEPARRASTEDSGERTGTWSDGERRTISTGRPDELRVTTQRAARTRPVRS
jgi:ribosome modulation factor